MIVSSSSVDGATLPSRVGGSEVSSPTSVSVSVNEPGVLSADSNGSAGVDRG